MTTKNDELPNKAPHNTIRVHSHWDGRRKDVILFETEDWENSFDSFDNFHAKCYQLNTKCAVSKNLCSKAHDVLVRGGPFAFAAQLTNCALRTWTQFPFCGESEVLALNWSLQVGAY